LNKEEELREEARCNDVDVFDMDFSSRKIKGLYCDGSIALSKELNETERICVLAEELGHYYTSAGDIINQRDVRNYKQERTARIWAYDKLIGLTGIVSAYRAGCRSRFEVANHLGVTEVFLNNALTAYKEKYGVCVTIDNYIIYFEPTLAVLNFTT